MSRTTRLFGASAMLLSAPENRFAAVVAMPGKAMVLQSEEGRRITRYPVNMGNESFAHAVQALSSRGYREASETCVEGFLQRSGFVPGHLQPLSAAF